ncbi:hypothetical protein PF005_g10863 [Phytophthora fragariae]|uniref:Uncharacterized protein n=1 Tax=Phytophthora fragariae TaxID=53985 RepID=A0A6A3ZH15_9STRA|nr:hypothetical protein PF009_g11107 [Phytophthora fragariae]KAE9112081.1 hypothetical protein PF010_g10572 [Phytophthora fragariae]KAE9112552.1 hypothetical protein PF006_g19954 [Phytophthora fragariae]KAE9118843.1 hypothetical protein PF007_g8781 [Phytophthora fragariae]KAE9211793.1 hypothetical protein PF005_g10863 [Phytophthora fragariae]
MSCPRDYIPVPKPGKSCGCNSEDEGPRHRPREKHSHSEAVAAASVTIGNPKGQSHQALLRGVTSASSLRACECGIALLDCYWRTTSTWRCMRRSS